MKQPQEKTIDVLVQDAIKYITIHSYSESSIYHYGRIWRKLLKYSHEQQAKYYSMELGLKFYRQLTGLNPDGNLDKLDSHILRPLRVLNDLALGNEVKKKYISEEPFVPESFASTLVEYKKHLLMKGQKKRTVETKISRIRVFLRFIGSRGIRLEDVDFKTIEAFYLFLSAEYATNARSNIQFSLRDYFAFVEKINDVKAGTSNLITTIYSNKHERLPSTYNITEINGILAAVDRSTKYGKRDYAILLLAAQLGMRSSDICYLKLGGIHLDEMCITFQQEKAGRMETLPITELMAYALADYLKNARPTTVSDLLFVHMYSNCESGYTGSNLYRIINKYMNKAEINTDDKRHGMHSMRHSLSSNLLKDGTPLPVISGILGHGSTEITMRYLWMNTEQLRKLSLEVPYEE